MPYIGNNHIAGDHTNNFKVLDDISSFTATFDGSATSVVDTTNNTIRAVEHRFIQGQRVTIYKWWWWKYWWTYKWNCIFCYL